MNDRTTPLKIPHPLRHPYLRVVVADRPYVVRVPSLHALTKMLRDSVPQQTLGKLITVSDPEMRSNWLLALQASPEICEVFGAVIGISWADPMLQLDATPGSPLDVSAFGAAVFEELHEAGWTLGHVADLGLALMEGFLSANRISEAVSERAAFFLRPREPLTPNESPSSATSSDDGEGSGSTN